MKKSRPDGLLPHRIGRYFTALLVGLVFASGATAAKGGITPPTNLSVTSKSFQKVVLAWTNNSTGEKNVIVSRSLQQTTGYADIATLAAKSTTYTDTTVSAGTTYYYQVSSVGGSKSRATSSPISVTTPSISITSPASSTTYTTAQTVSIAAALSDVNSAGITKVEFYDGSTLLGTDTSAPYTYAWAITTANNGTHSWTVKAYDGNGGIATSAPVSLTVNIACVYTISTGASPAAGGSTSGGGTKTCNSSVTVTATPSSCYQFVNWTEGGVVVSTSASYIFTATANRTLVANFSQPSYSISTSSSPAAGGSTSGGGTKTCGTSVTVAATPAAGYSFVNWTEGGVQVSASASYTFTASANRTLVANFSTCTYSITTSSSPAGGGSTSGGGSKSCNSSVTVTATPSSCYNFVTWTEGGVVVSTSASYTFTATGNRTLVANFSQPSYSISTSSSPAAGGSTSGGGSKVCGTSVTVAATPAAGYSFVNWTEGATVVSTSASYTFTASANRTLVANFSNSTCTYSITTSSSPAAGGSTSGGGSKTCNSSVTVTATPSSCYNFVNWTEGGVVVSTSASYTFTATGNRTLVANFSQPNYSISTSSSPAAGGSTSGGGSKVCGTSVTVTATPAAGYSFVNWTEGVTVVSTAASYTFTASANRTLVANFSSSTCTYSITTSSSPAAGGSTSGGGSKICNSSVTVTATANAGYRFLNWTEGATVVSTLASYTFTASANRTLVANFAACTYSISPTGNTTVGSSGGAYSVSVTAGAGCSWTATSPVTWVSITAGGSGSGNGTVNYSVAANTNTTSRSTTLTIAGQSFAVTQAALSCSVTITPTSANFAAAGGSGSITVSAGPSCNWTASSGATWITITSGSTGKGNGTVTYSVAANTSTSSRTGTIGIDGRTFTVTQAALCTPPTATTTAASGVTATSAILNGNSNPNGCATTAYFQYGTTTAYGSTTASQSLGSGTTATTTAATIGSLAASTTYHYRLVSSNNGGTTFGADVTFTTAASCTAPAVTTGAATGISSSGATLNGTDNPNGCATMAYFQWGTTTAYGSASSAQSADTGSASTTLSGLSASTTYHYRLVAYNSSGTSFGGDMTFTTSASTAPPGSTLWAKAIGGTGSDYGYAVAKDISGNTLVAGFFTGTVDFGGGPLTSAGGEDIFVAKYSTTGTHVWSKRFGGTGSDVAYGMTVDKNNDVVAVGSFSGITTIGTNTFTSSGLQDIFVLKLSGTSGSSVWSRQCGGPNDDTANAVASDPATGEIAVTGQYSRYANFGGGNLAATSSGIDSFLAKYDSSGNYLWAKHFNAGGTDGGDSVAIDSVGNILLAGNAGGPIDLGQGLLPYNLFAGTYAVYVGKFSAAGSNLWGRCFGSTSTSRAGMAGGVAVDSSGNVAVAARFDGPVDFGSGVSLSLLDGTSCGTVVKLSGVNGNAIWAKGFVGASGCQPHGVACDGSGNVVATGVFAGSCNFGSTANQISAGSSDVFVTKLSASGSFVWSGGGGGAGQDFGFAVAIDSSGSPLVTGLTSGGSFGGVNLTSAGGFDVLLIKLAP